QHNGEIGSGAWRTKSKRPWEMVLCIYGFPTNISALQVENQMLQYILLVFKVKRSSTLIHMLFSRYIVCSEILSSFSPVERAKKFCGDIQIIATWHSKGGAMAAFCGLDLVVVVVGFYRSQTVVVCVSGLNCNATVSFQVDQLVVLRCFGVIAVRCSSVLVVVDAFSFVFRFLAVGFCLILHQAIHNTILVCYDLSSVLFQPSASINSSSVVVILRLHGNRITILSKEDEYQQSYAIFTGSDFGTFSVGDWSEDDKKSRPLSE
ncbi:hypothetical protein RYX36_037023, partial [Vicia faba]